MVKVITYGTYDLLHYGHIRLLERAKALGDYLIVGITTDDFDLYRGKINVQQSLMERIEAVRATGIADEIIIEEYEGQKINDILKYGIDIFTVGSDWEGKFDYLNEYCKVVYLDRTQGVSSSEIRSEKAKLRLGLVGKNKYLDKFLCETEYVNGIETVGICFGENNQLSEKTMSLPIVTSNLEELLPKIDAVYIHSTPQEHYEQVKMALQAGKHVMCESPLALKKSECEELRAMASQKELVLMESLRTAYSTAFNRMLLAIKAGKIGDVVAIDATCTSLKEIRNEGENGWNSITAWAPTALLPIFGIFGTSYKDINIVTKLANNTKSTDLFTKIDLLYDTGVASIKVGYGVKSEGELLISGTKGYVYVPAPWWKTDYYEFRYENSEDNKRAFFQLEGEGIRNEVVSFLRIITSKTEIPRINEDMSIKIAQIMEKFHYERDFKVI